jgi:RNA polymerase sigma factor (TIGR02999 family)
VQNSFSNRSIENQRPGERVQANRADRGSAPQITSLLQLAHDGDTAALEQVIPLVYTELKRLARSHMRRERSAETIQTTALVHEAFLRLASSRFPDCQNRSHFYAIAAKVMRQVLVDMARSRGAAKRGPGVEHAVAELPDFGVAPEKKFLALDEALHRLASASPLKGQLIELRFFAGLTPGELAQTFAIPLNSVRRELRLAKAWLHKELA